MIPASEGQVPHLPTEDVYTAILEYSLKPNLHSIKHSRPGPGLFLGLAREEVDAQHVRGESRAKATVISTTEAEAMSETRNASRHELNYNTVRNAIRGYKTWPGKTLEGDPLFVEVLVDIIITLQ